LNNALASGGRARGHHQRHVREFFAQRIHQRRRGLHLAHRHRVHPDAAAALHFGAQAEALRETLPVAAIAKSAHGLRREHHGRQ